MRCAWCGQSLVDVAFYALDGYQNKMEHLGCFCSAECMERAIVDYYGLGALAEPESEPEEHCSVLQSRTKGIYGGRGAE